MLQLDYRSHHQLKEHLCDFVMAYNYAKKNSKLLMVLPRLNLYVYSGQSFQNYFY